LIPLRQYPANRLTPLVDRFVTDGYREGTSERVINRPEAAAAARTVVECLEDPRYRGKSFGVICLQGHAQSQLIEQMILERIGPDPFKDAKTRLLCGDSYSFQGDERDIIILSMVAALDGDSRNTALTQKRFLQRFNVAASRARDQLWLLHSVRETDLHPNCVRRSLVQFMSSNPELQSPTVDLAAVRHEAAIARRDIDHSPPPFDSWFEVDVFLAMIDRGYRVLPQYPVAGKRIDLVVEDAQRRIAVECDGDEWHGPDEYEADCIREGIISRCGWQFARIRASSFYAGRLKAVEKLIGEISLHGVRPWTSSAGEATYSAVEIGEVSGADSLRWLGEQVADTAEAGLSQMNVVDAGAATADVEDDHAVNVVSPTNEQRSLFEKDDEPTAPASARSERIPKVSPSGGERFLSRSVLQNEVLACLFQANKRLTEGQIRWRTKITEEIWPDVERELLQKNLIRKTGAGKRARFELVGEKPPEGLSPVAAAFEGGIETVSAEIWFSLSHWAKLKNLLEPWQRGLAYSLGRLKQAGDTPTDKQLRQGQRILDECRRSGFFDDVTVR
jgi:very-short-patch-repair endonuclease